ncbi:MAG: GTPase ObgE [Acidobacteria bacterium]|nr:GTPase ObgE [Acidobacteriota bacterium]
MFVDQARIQVVGGSGGDGCVSFRREKFVPRGGPDGGSGGAGGSVIFEADPSLKALNAFRFRRRFTADRGRHGSGSGCTGRSGEDLILKVPPGTLIMSDDGEIVFADLVREGDRVCLAKGGRGGRGNASFATSTHQAPREFGPGRPGEEFDLLLELKLIADVGIIGFPNAGKSTLISRISAARPKIADYPFTTLEPNLGVVDLGQYRTLVVADIPGLIEGAHAGQGLGMQFLRHVERTRVLIHLIDVSDSTAREPLEDMKIINAELGAFSATLRSKPQMVVASKIDALQSPERLAALEKQCAADGTKLHRISAVSGEGIRELLEAVWALVESAGSEDSGDNEETQVERRH